MHRRTLPYPGPARRLVHHDPGVGQGVPHAGRACGQQQAAHAGGLAHAPRGDGVEDVLHGVVDGQAGRHHAAWGWRRGL